MFNVTHSGTEAHHDQVVAVGIELRSKNFGNDYTPAPKRTEHLSDEHMLDDALSKSGIMEMG